MKMANEKKLPEGLRVFARHPNAPDFVKFSMAITLNALVKFCKDNPELLSEYNGEKQLKVQGLTSRDGKLYLAVDDYKPGQAAPQAGNMAEVDDLPF